MGRDGGCRTTGRGESQGAASALHRPPSAGVRAPAQRVRHGAVDEGADGAAAVSATKTTQRRETAEGAGC